MPLHNYFPYTQVFLIQVKYIIIWESRFSLCIFFIWKLKKSFSGRIKCGRPDFFFWLQELKKGIYSILFSFSYSPFSNCNQISQCGSYMQSWHNAFRTERMLIIPIILCDVYWQNIFDVVKSLYNLSQEGSWCACLKMSIYI